MRSIPAFSKKSSAGPTIGGGGQRNGFTPHVKQGSPSKEKSVPHMASNYPVKSTLTRTVPKGNPHTPAAISGSGKAAKSVPAFSKTKLSGVPKRRS